MHRSRRYWLGKCAWQFQICLPRPFRGRDTFAEQTLVMLYYSKQKSGMTALRLRQKSGLTALRLRQKSGHTVLTLRDITKRACHFRHITSYLPISVFQARVTKLRPLLLSLTRALSSSNSKASPIVCLIVLSTRNVGMEKSCAHWEKPRPKCHFGRLR